MIHRIVKFRLARVLGGAALFVLPGVAVGQVIERHPAPALPPPPPQITAPVEADQNADATSLGITLKSLRVDSGSAEVLRIDDASKVASSAVPGMTAHLRRFIGQDLSRKLIAEIRTEIVRRYRAAGHPFVHVSAPEQDLSAGALTLRVQEFTVGKIGVNDSEASDARHIVADIRLRSGQTIGSDVLAQDLDWLNRYPFRRVDAVFSPGSTPGATDVTYNAARSKPWSLGGGYANSGSPDTGLNRFDISVLAALPIVPDALASYQLTTSGQGIVGLDNPPSGSKRYVSHAGRIVIPTGARQALELTFDDIQTAQPVEVFDNRQHTREWGLTYRFALSALGARLPGEIHLGLDWKTQASALEFDGVAVRSSEFHVGQIDLGYSWHSFDSHGSTTLDLTVHASPSGLDSLDKASAYATASQGTSQTARYAYVTGLVSRKTQFSGFNLGQSLTWQYSGVRLPQTELFGLGGPGQVRAYTLDDGAFDRGVVLRNELRLDAVSWSSGRRDSIAQPYLYGDAGYAGRPGIVASHVIGAIGAGIDLQLFRRLVIAADGGLAIADQGNTKSGAGRANVSVNLTF